MEKEKTIAMSANITVWGGLMGILMDAVPAAKKMRTYSMAGFSEILMVLKEGTEATPTLATDTFRKHGFKRASSKRVPLDIGNSIE